MKRNLFLIFVLLFALNVTSQDCDLVNLESIGNLGPYIVGTLTEDDGIRNGPDYFEGTLSYPISTEAQFASIVIVPGFFSDEADIETWGPFLASHGIVTMTIGTNSYFDFPGDRAEALLDALVTIAQEDTRDGSPLFGKIDETRFGVSGWSMGGGGAQLAAAMDPTLKASMALCPWLSEGNLNSSLDHPVPVLIFSGENDPTAPVNSHANLHYDATPSNTNKLKFEVDGGNHSVANTPSGANGDVGKIAVSWLKKYLVGEPCYCPNVLPTPATASEYFTNVNCEGISNMLVLNLKTFLQGPYAGGNMNDGLRISNYLPLTEPYTQLGMLDANFGGQMVAPSVLNVTGEDAIVDWILVEVRDGINSSTVMNVKPGLLQRDGDIVDVDGVSPLIFENINYGLVNVAIRHRNHLGVRTSVSYYGEEIVLDFSDPDLQLYGTDAMVTMNDVRMMISGNANGDTQINSFDKNAFWRPQNGQPYDYYISGSDFDMNGSVNALDKNSQWQPNNSKAEQLD